MDKLLKIKEVSHGMDVWVNLIFRKWCSCNLCLFNYWLNNKLLIPKVGYPFDGWIRYLLSRAVRFKIVSYFENHDGNAFTTFFFVLPLNSMSFKERSLRHIRFLYWKKYQEQVTSDLNPITCKHWSYGIFVWKEHVMIKCTLRKLIRCDIRLRLYK